MFEDISTIIMDTGEHYRKADNHQITRQHSCCLYIRYNESM